MTKVLEVHVNKSLGAFKIEKVFWGDKEVPWPINQLEIQSDPYSGYTVKLWMENGDMELYPEYINYKDNTPPAPKCDCCGQEIKEQS